MSKLVIFDISSSTHPSKLPISNAWVIDSLDLPRFRINKDTFRNRWTHLQDIEIEVDDTQEISILIGADFPQLHVSQDVRIGKENEPIAILTPLGWVLMGEQDKPHSQRNRKPKQ